MYRFKNSFNPQLISAFVKVGGYEKLIEDYFEARASNRSYVDPSNETMGMFCDDSKSSECCGEVKEHSMHLFRSMHPGDSDLPWTGIRKYCFGNLFKNQLFKLITYFKVMVPLKNF